jgi:anti-sigma-K factor RskA
MRAALAADPELRARLRADREALAALIASLPEVALPAGAEDRLMTRLAAERAAAPAAVAAAPANRRLPWWPLAALGLAAALAAAFVLRPLTADPLRQYAGTPGATSQAIEANGTQLGQLVRLPDGRAYLHLTRPADAGRVYQAWQIQGETPVSLGVFDGQGFLLTGLPPGATVAVSVEPTGGSQQPTTTPILVQQL